MSKKQRDSLYAEVQRHQQSQEFAGAEFAGAEPCEDSGELGAHGRAYSRGSSTAFSDHHDMGALAEGLLFDLPLTPDYCALDVTGGGGGGSNSAGSSSSSQSSPEQNGGLDLVDVNNHIKHEYQLLQDSGLFSRAIAIPPPDGCSGLELGQETPGPPTPRLHHVYTQGAFIKCHSQ